jgi:hypothetical protein
MMQEIEGWKTLPVHTSPVFGLAQKILASFPQLSNNSGSAMLQAIAKIPL